MDGSGFAGVFAVVMMFGISVFCLAKGFYVKQIVVIYAIIAFWIIGAIHTYYFDKKEERRR